MHRWWVVLSGGCHTEWVLEGWAHLGLETVQPTRAFSSLVDSGYPICQLSVLGEDFPRQQMQNWLWLLLEVPESNFWGIPLDKQATKASQIHFSKQRICAISSLTPWVIFLTLFSWFLQRKWNGKCQPHRVVNESWINFMKLLPKLLLMFLINLFLLKLILFPVPVLIIPYSEFGSHPQADIILPLMNTSIMSQI